MSGGEHDDNDENGGGGDEPYSDEEDERKQIMMNVVQRLDPQLTDKSVRKSQTLMNSHSLI